MTMQIFDHADGVRGHYCIGRKIGQSIYWEFFDKGIWCSSGQVYTSRDTAEFAMKRILDGDRSGEGEVGPEDPERKPFR